MSKKIVNLKEIKKFYVANILFNAKLNKPWTAKESKFNLHILSLVSDNRIFLGKSEDYSGLDDPSLQETISKIDHKFEMTREQFISVVGVEKSHAAREINTVCDGVLEKVLDLRNPLDPNNKKSFKKIQIYSEAEYNDQTGKIEIKVHEKAMPFLVVLKQYTQLHVGHYYKLKNKHSIAMYLYFKIFQRSYKDIAIIDTTVDELKENLGIQGKYAVFTIFKRSVLDVIENEINEKTDLDISYTLKKDGKSYVGLQFFIKSKENINESTNTLEFAPSPEPTDDNSKQNNKDVLLRLRSYGIKESKATDLITTYGYDAAVTSIETLLSKINEGKNIKNISGYLIKIIENYATDISSSKILDNVEKDKLHKEKINKELEDNWISIETHCQKRSKEIDDLHEILKSGSKIFDQTHVETQDEIKMMLEVNQDLINSPRPISGIYVNDGHTSVTFGLLNKLVDDIAVANPVDRMPFLKKALDSKNDALRLLPEGVDRDYLVSEIKDLKALLYSLI